LDIEVSAIKRLSSSLRIALSSLSHARIAFSAPAGTVLDLGYFQPVPPRRFRRSRLVFTADFTILIAMTLIQGRAVS
jgi:hypothetical protein